MNFLDNAVSAVFGAIPFIDDQLEDAADYLNVELEGLVEDGVTEADELYESAAGMVEDSIQDSASAAFRALFEPKFESQLESFDSDLGVDDGDFSFEGTDDDAIEAATEARETIISEFKQTKRELEVTALLNRGTA